MQQLSEFLRSKPPEHSEHQLGKPETITDLNSLIESLTTELDQGKAVHEAFLTKSDPILDALTKLFDGCIGAPYSPEQLGDIERG